MIEWDFEYESERSRRAEEKRMQRWDDTELEREKLVLKAARAEQSKKARTRRANARRNAKTLRAEKRAAGITGCEVCGWNTALGDVLHVHHMRPLSCGGSDEASNLIQLCPNCHGLAHALWPIWALDDLTKECGAPSDVAQFAGSLRAATFSATSNIKQLEVNVLSRCPE